MNKFLYSFFVLFSSYVYSQNDTTHVQAHVNAQLTWYGNYDAIAAFPIEDISYEKILMDFTMGCADGGCSHWDYTVSVYLMHPTGVLDSNITVLDTLSIEPFEVDTTWNVYEVIEKFELGRLITPYGNYMDWNQPTDPNDLYDENWDHSYIFDVTDFAPLLTDSSLIRVHYDGWSSGFSATVDFDFIEGIPPREVLSIENIAPVGGYSYQSLADDQNFQPITKIFNEQVEGVAVKSYVSGHGHEGPQSCCEWVSKQHSISINGDDIYQWDVWKDCGMIPIYPQGGTWPFDRAGWCPGTGVDLQVSELTEFIDLDSEVEIDYSVQAYTDNGEQAGTFIVSNTLFTYGNINFENDVEILDIVKPTNKDNWTRMNPICGSPMVKIRNRGSKFLTSATIKYGIQGGTLSSYEWNGALDFLESTSIELPVPNWSGVTEDSKFIATVISEDDMYLNNNSLTTNFDIPDVLPGTFVFEFRTQTNYGSTNRASQSSFFINDINGNLIFENTSPLQSYTWYKDTINLPFGCYELIFKDSAEDGVNEHWYYGEASSAAGKVQIRNMNGDIIKKFPDDFGQQIDYRFTVDYPLRIEPLGKATLDLYPNPASDFLSLNLSLPSPQDVSFVLYNNLGEELSRIDRSNYTVGSEIFDLRFLNIGMYYIKAITPTNELLNKFIIVR